MVWCQRRALVARFERHIVGRFTEHWRGLEGPDGTATSSCAQEQYGYSDKRALRAPRMVLGGWVANKDCMSCCFGMINYRGDYRPGIQ